MRPGIDEIRQLGEFQTQYNWNITITPPPGLASFGNGSEFNTRAQTTALPTVKNPDIPITLHGFKTNQPGFAEFNGELDVTFVEGVSAIIQKFFHQWQTINFDVKNKGVQATRAQRETTIILEPYDNNNVTTLTYTLIGCYIEDFIPGTLDGSKQEMMQPQAKFRYDYFTTA